MKTARIVLDSAHTVSEVHRRTFGGFVEHMGRSVYGGIYEPDHQSADVDGFRGDVLDLTRELGISSVRYPGGNFVSGYRWEDGVGPREQREPRIDLAWHSTDPNTFGLDEFMLWARKAEVEPIMVANLGTRGVQEAIDLLEYCNLPGGSKYADMRRANGAADPYNVRMWCLGNEMYGPWQIGRKSALDYGNLALATSRAMRRVDPSLELVLCGLSPSGMPAFGQWASEALEIAYDEVDYVGAHAYYWESSDLASFLASGAGLDAFLHDTISIIDSVRARLGSSRRVNVAFDEWNVWYKTAKASEKPADTWPIAPHLLEDRYNVADAVVVGSMLISLLKRSDRVTTANLAQLVNVIAPIMTEPDGPAWRQTTFYPFAITAALARGNVIRAGIEAPYTDTAEYGEVAMIDAVATSDGGSTTLFVVNRSVTDQIELTIDRGNLPPGSSPHASTLSHPDPHQQASALSGGAYAPAPSLVTEHGNTVQLVLPPVSWTAVSL